MRGGGSEPPHHLQLDRSGKVEYIRTAGGSVRIFVDTLWRDPAEQRTISPAKKRHDAGRATMSSEESVDEPPDLGLLFHRLNNQLGIILANAELLEAKAADDITAPARPRWSRACSTRWRPREKSA